MEGMNRLHQIVLHNFALLRCSEVHQKSQEIQELEGEEVKLFFWVVNLLPAEISIVSIYEEPRPLKRVGFKIYSDRQRPDLYRTKL